MPPKALGKPPDVLEPITPFILRGKQMIRADPIITYWCFHWAMKLAWELQESRQEKSDEARHYMLSLMDELETRKGAVAESEKELVEVDIAAQAYVEDFAGKILEKGRKAVEEERETANTVETLLAASVFLEVLRIFSPDGQLDEETTKKVKFAKYHAVRIRAALRKKDSNVVETPPLPAEPDASNTSAPSIPPKPTIEEVPDAESTSPPPTQSTLSINTTPSALPTAPAPTPASPSYFPPTPEIHEPSAPTLSPTTMSSANTIFPDIIHVDHTYPAPSPPQPPYTTTSIPSPPQQPTFGAPALPSLPTSYYTGAPSPGISAPHHLQPQNYYHQQPIPQPQSEIVSRPKKEVTPEDIAKAQKFAKWAISALDYEDVENAIEQFRSGLKALGAL